MTSFCDEEEEDDKGAAGLLGEIENALGMGIGALGTNRWIKFNSLNLKSTKTLKLTACVEFSGELFFQNDVRQCYVEAFWLRPSSPYKKCCCEHVGQPEVGGER